MVGAGALDRHRHRSRPASVCCQHGPRTEAPGRAHDGDRHARGLGRPDEIHGAGAPLDERPTRSGAPMNLLTVNLIFSTVVFYVAARIYLWPRLPELEPRTVLVPILLLHAFRHLGLMFLAPGAIYPGMPPEFAYPAALGDLVAALLALAALWALVRSAGISRALVWIFNLWGTADLATAIVQGTRYGADPFMGAAYWIPTFWVPALLVTHYITFVVLLKYWKASPWPRSSRSFTT